MFFFSLLSGIVGVFVFVCVCLCVCLCVCFPCVFLWCFFSRLCGLVLQPFVCYPFLCPISTFAHTIWTSSRSTYSCIAWLGRCQQVFTTGRSPAGVLWNMSHVANKWLSPTYYTRGAYFALRPLHISLGASEVSHPNCRRCGVCPNPQQVGYLKLLCSCVRVFMYAIIMCSVSGL